MLFFRIQEQEVCVIPEAWYCVWYGRHYAGEKHCATCNTGIYSIEEAAWQENYLRPVNGPGQQSSEDLGLSAPTSGRC
ncbi:zinc-ribbon domain-containing protein [Citrobacter sp. Cpo126]|nr:putative zinc ribbon protein [Citrobacter sp. Cpo126]MDM2772723.1 zinc-ribbon domain-containing protein [Citrobacter sp. Cpo126]